MAQGLTPSLCCMSSTWVSGLHSTHGYDTRVAWARATLLPTCNHALQMKRPADDDCILCYDPQGNTA